MLKEAIRCNWQTDISGYAQIISKMQDTGYPAWTVKILDSYGVAIPYDGEDIINENFANARIYSDNIVCDDKTVKKALILSTSTEGIETTFSAICCELIDPGLNVEKRKKITSDPLEWWKSWKEMIGNRNIDPRIYDVLGELCVFKLLLSEGVEASWNGPKGTSYDIDTDSGFIEVKSTIVRDRREVTISNPQQLDPKDKPLSLVLCQFEPTTMTGISIDSVVDEFEQMGYNVADINTKLSKMGFDPGMSSRKKTFILHGMLKYKVDSQFPRMTLESFVGGVMPAGITKYTYTVDLGGLIPESMI